MDDAFVIYKFFLKSSELFESEEIAAICNTLQRTSSLPPLLAPKEIENYQMVPVFTISMANLANSSTSVKAFT